LEFLRSIQDDTTLTFCDVLSADVTVAVSAEARYPLPYQAMKALGITLVVALSLAGLPELAEADGRRGGGWSRHSGGFSGHHGRGGHHHHRSFSHRPFFPAFPVFAAPSVILSSPVVVAPSTVYAPQVYAASPGPVYSGAWGPPQAYAAPPAPPIPRVVEYPGGRYELRGDGVTSPYVWVWVPNPPAAPPVPPSPAAPPVEAPEPSLSPRTPAPRSTAYRWTDDNGVTTWTDNLEKVPPRFRAQAYQSALGR
jgi:hypothetical protein